MDFVAGMEKIRMIFSEDAHTFSYNGKHYDVNYLIDYVTKEAAISVKPIKNPIDTILEREVQSTWGTLKLNRDGSNAVLPITFKDLLSHIKRIVDANYQKYPIIVLVGPGSSKMQILDGRHRILKAELDGKSMIPAYTLTIDHMEEFISMYSSSEKWR